MSCYYRVCSLLGIFSVVLLDQLTKLWIILHIPLNTIGFSWWGGWFRLIHVRNLGVAFSFGNSFPQIVRFLFFILAPLIFLGYLFFILLTKTGFLREVKWIGLGQVALVLVIGGGLGNLLDRLFKEGVVDFIDVGFFGILGLSRWPAFNLADSCVFLGALLWIITFSLRPSKLPEDKLRERHL